jgi:hypothetical protein
MTLDIAERLIEYKNKMSQVWLEKGNKNEKSELSVEEESD